MIWCWRGRCRVCGAWVESYGARPAVVLCRRCQLKAERALGLPRAWR